MSHIFVLCRPKYSNMRSAHAGRLHTAYSGMSIISNYGCMRLEAPMQSFMNSSTAAVQAAVTLILP